MGASWSRAQQGVVEQCLCVNSEIECVAVEHKSKALFGATAVGLHGMGIKDSDGIKA